MNDSLKKLLFTLLGGDRREVELWRLWKARGMKANLVGFEEYPGLSDEICAKADHVGERILIVPLSGIGADGMVKAPFSKKKRLPVLPHLEPAPLMLLAGSAPPELRRRLPAKTKLFCTLDDEELLLLNAVPTAEGALQKAMELSLVTLHGSRSVVLGLGRCGGVIARVLHGLGATVSAVVRRRESAALARVNGFKAYYFSEVLSAVQEADFVFNTVPARVVPAAVLAGMKRDALVLDLAAAPGGVDFKAASEMGIKAVLLPGLPGEAAPRTAGNILDHVYRRLITAETTE